MSKNVSDIMPSTFNRRLTVKRSTPTVDAGGGVSSTFTDLYTTWASVVNMSTSRKMYLGIDLFTNAYDIRFRYAGSDILTSDMLQYEGGLLKIIGTQLVTESYKKFWVLTAVEVSQNG
jgi:head-tail adaptor